MSAQHTPGPWHVVTQDGEVLIRAAVPGHPGCEGLVAIADCEAKVNLANYADADARLIAAAPELLAVVQSLVYGLQDAEEILDLARIALAKAEGA